MWKLNNKKSIQRNIAVFYRNAVSNSQIRQSLSVFLSSLKTTVTIKIQFWYFLHCVGCALDVQNVVCEEQSVEKHSFE